LKQALKRLTSLDLILAEGSNNGILYVEGTTDVKILKEFARILESPAMKFFESPYVCTLQGNNPREAREHFHALQAINPNIKGLLVLDGDNRRVAEHDISAPNLTVHRWIRYEIESYLMLPEVLDRFVNRYWGALLGPDKLDKARKYFDQKVPATIRNSPMDDDDYLIQIGVSKTVFPEFFKAAEMDVTKQDYYKIASCMKKNEIHPEIVSLLDDFAIILGLEKNGEEES
jgi:hypothetical protein